LNQPGIPAGKTFVYEFTARRPGTFMYHPHADEMTQILILRGVNTLSEIRGLAHR
jgi:FtsP/CotA-like multicopper oxidase with cupredoxin domain